MSHIIFITFLKLQCLLRVVERIMCIGEQSAAAAVESCDLLEQVDDQKVVS